MTKRTRIAPPAVGGASLLVIFAVLCMTVFALLTLTGTLAEGRLTRASVDAVSAYYAADCQAETIYARLRAGETPEAVTVQGETYTYSCPISEHQRLEVVLTCRDGMWQVLRWQAVSTATADDALPDIWDGGSIS